MEKSYQDTDGRECNLYQMIQREPGWAASRIRTLEEMESRGPECFGESKLGIRKIVALLTSKLLLEASEKVTDWSFHDVAVAISHEFASEVASQCKNEEMEALMIGARSLELFHAFGKKREEIRNRPLERGNDDE